MLKNPKKLCNNYAIFVLFICVLTSNKLDDCSSHITFNGKDTWFSSLLLFCDILLNKRL